MAVLIALTALLAIACEDGARQAASSGTDGTAPAGATASPSVRQRVSSLVPPVDVSFQVIFRQRTPYSEEGSYFVWTQGNGMRRWDWVLTDSGKAGMGNMSIETAFAPGDPLADAGMACGWYAWANLPPGQVQLECHSGSDWTLAPFVPVADAVRSYVTDRLPDQTVAERTAACYSFEHFRYSVAVFCVDSEAGTPLLLTMVSPGTPQFTGELEAISVSTAEQHIAVPDIELEEDPLLGPLGEAVVPYSTLQLPDFSQFEE
jgi:hypothetical protein